ncbi:hypothetical protein RchiOBHm_Chr1g0376201 [Rosa chinensis]|uniref:Uncharacterized protein n=1 Tax=Rosa chinensis TaxID=74649 RepID=A0A2P6SMS6_ROSCH|nr:hypothetical protein RchiOBHm_Chr1g0376201 [Rosa chinensis]
MLGVGAEFARCISSPVSDHVTGAGLCLAWSSTSVVAMAAAGELDDDGEPGSQTGLRGNWTLGDARVPYIGFLPIFGAFGLVFGC